MRKSSAIITVAELNMIMRKSLPVYWKGVKGTIIKATIDNLTGRLIYAFSSTDKNVKGSWIDEFEYNEVKL